MRIRNYIGHLRARYKSNKGFFYKKGSKRTIL